MTGQAVVLARKVKTKPINTVASKADSSPLFTVEYIRILFFFASPGHVVYAIMVNMPQQLAYLLSLTIGIGALEKSWLLAQGSPPSTKFGMFNSK